MPDYHWCVAIIKCDVVHASAHTLANQFLIGCAARRGGGVSRQQGLTQRQKKAPAGPPAPHYLFCFVLMP